MYYTISNLNLRHKNAPFCLPAAGRLYTSLRTGLSRGAKSIIFLLSKFKSELVLSVQRPKFREKGEKAALLKMYYAILVYFLLGL